MLAIQTCHGADTWLGKRGFVPILQQNFKGTLSPRKIFSYMKHIDPLSTKKPSKNSSDFFNLPKNALKVQFSVLN